MDDRNAYDFPAALAANWTLPSGRRERLERERRNLDRIDFGRQVPILLPRLASPRPLDADRGTE